MNRTAGPLLLLAGLAGCATTETAPVMMHRHSTIRPRSMQPIVQQGYRETLDPSAGPYGRRTASAYTQVPTRPLPPRQDLLPPPPPTQGAVASRGWPPEEMPNWDDPPVGRPRAVAVPSGEEEAEDEEGADVLPPPMPSKPRKKTAAAPDLFPSAQTTEQPLQTPARTIRAVNTRRVQLAYEIPDSDGAGVSQVDVWYTQGGGRWQRYGSAMRKQSPYVVEVPGEGVYGFLMLASVEGSASPPPQPDDRPQMSIEVDLTPPDVQVVNTRAESEGRQRNLTIQWSATDKNLRDGTVVLSYAREDHGPWQPIVSGLDNSGQYAWKVPGAVPHRFFVKVEVEDWAGNIGSAVTSKPVVYETPRPPVNIKAVEPAAQQSSSSQPTLRVQPIE